MTERHPPTLWMTRYNPCNLRLMTQATTVKAHEHQLLWINLTAFAAGVATCAAFISFLSPHTPQFPITCPEDNICYSTDNNTVWEYTECVIDYGNKLIVCKIEQAQVKPKTDT